MNSAAESIFLSVKKMLGVAEEYHAFDLDIMIQLNSVFLNLAQLGVGPKTPYQITGETDTWADFLGDDQVKFPGIQTYVYLKTRLLFDPPTNSYLISAIQDQIAELEFRFEVASVENKLTGGDSNGTDMEGEGTDNRNRSRASWGQGNEVGDPKNP